MRHISRDLVGGLWGLTAGVGAMLPSTVCPGGSCASCFACVGVGGVVVSIVAARYVFGRPVARPARGSSATSDRQVAVPTTHSGDGDSS